MLKTLEDTAKIIFLLLIIDINGFQVHNDFDNSAINVEHHSFSYTVAVLRKHSFLTTAALISESWAISDANELFGLENVKRELKLRINSVNYKKGGQVIPVKYFEIHPKFNETSPSFDVALVQLSKPISSTSSVKPIKILDRQKRIMTSHFIVTYWPVAMIQESQDRTIIPIHEKRNLQSSHLHPGGKIKCLEYLLEINVTEPENLLCLDPANTAESCQMDIWRGAPVVLNRVLWGVASSWTPEYCGKHSPIIVNLLSSEEVSSWITNIIGE